MLDELVRDNVREVKTTPNARPPRPAQCQLVKRLAARSIAAHAKVALKDFLAAVDGQPAASLAPELYAQPAEERRYLFYARQRHEQIELHTTGIEIGVAVAPTADAIKATFRPARPDYLALQSLWEAHDWEALGQLSQATLNASSQFRETPALLFRGAALFETGFQREGLDLVRDYAQRFASDWTMNFAAVAFFYEGLAAFERGEAAPGQKLLETAYDYNEFERVAQAIEKHTGRRPPARAARWLGRRYPVDYRLGRIEGEVGTVSLTATLTAMAPRQLQLVCLLANYRGNGPYADFMRRYRNYATHFAAQVHGLHVITMENNRNPNHSWYYAGEDEVRAAGLPVEVLLDPDGSATLPLEPTRSPFILALDQRGTVVYEGELDSVDFWETLDRAGLL